MTADRWSNLLAVLAGVVGLAVVIRTWPRRPRRTQVARLRHPSSPPPVGVVLDTSGDFAHWRVLTSPASLVTTIDIVTWRAVGPRDDWRSEPIVEPIELEPGGSATLPLVVDDPTSAHLVVVAWTVRHPGGDVQGSRTLTIGATSSTLPAPVPAHRGSMLLAASALIAALLVVLVLVAGWRVVDGDAVDEPATDSPIASGPAVTTEAPTAASTVPDQTATPPLAPTTTAATTASVTAPPTTTPTVTPSSRGTTPSPDPAGRSIEVRGRVEDCRFGADCIIAGFSAIGFPTVGDYVCEFADGSRFTFRYAGGGALDACATSGESPSVTIEIDGVRSATITREAIEAD